MLRVMGTSTERAGNVSINEYVPLTFRLEPSLRPNPILWRLGDSRRNLFELKVDRVSGEVFGATLIITDQKMSHGGDCPCSHLPNAPGVPLADVSVISDSVVDEPAMFRLVEAHGCVAVLFGASLVPTSCLSIGRFRFLLDGELLLGVCYGPLSQDELELTGLTKELE